MSQSRGVLERFLDVLVKQITATHPEYLTAPFTVAEIYQELVPYHSHRDLIGVEMNGDYEDALFRMLSGEGDYLVLDSEVALREMQAELATANPNAGLFHDFAAAEVRLHPSRVPASARTGPEVQPEERAADEPSAEPVGAKAEEAAPVGPSRPEPGGSSEGGVVGHIETASNPPLASVKVAPPDRSETKDAESSDAMRVCHWCREALPARDSIHFCPFCGSDLRPSPCRKCGEPMEARWQFCGSCGTDVRA